MSKALEIEEHKKELKHLDRSALNRRSLEIAEFFLRQYPDTYKEKIKSNRELQAIKELLK